MTTQESHSSPTGSSITKLGLGLGIAALFLFLSGFFIWLTPLPIIYAYRKNGRLLGVVSIFVALASLILLYEILIPLMTQTFPKLGEEGALFWVPGIGFSSEGGWNPIWLGISYFLFYGLAGALLGEWQEKSQSMTLLTGKTLLVLMGGLFVWVLWEIGGNFGQLVVGVEHYFLFMVDQMETGAAKTPELEQQVALIRSYKDPIVYYTVRLIPAVTISMTIFIIWLNVLVGKKLFFKERVFENLEVLKNWRLSFDFIWALITTAFLFILNIYFIHNGALEVLALNAFVIFSLVYFFQGLAIVAFYLSKWSLPPLVKILFYFVFLLFFQALGILLVAFGLFDSWFDFRKLSSKDSGAT